MTLHNLARVVSSTTGTGAITLGAAVSGFLTFADAGVTDGEVVTYAIRDGTNSEIGAGTYASTGTVLTRTTIYNSTNSGNAIDLSGSEEVFITAAAEDFPIYPQDAIVFINQFKIASGVTGGWNKGAATSQMFNIEYSQATPANGDKVQTTVTLKAGTYDVYVLGSSGTNRGKIDWALDGGAAFISGQDWYNATPVYNAINTGTVTIAAGGRHLLTATINGKNGSSSNYYMVFTAIWFVDQSQAAET